MGLIHSNGHSVVIKSVMNKFIMLTKLAKHLCISIYYKFMAIKIVLNEFCHFTVINLSLHFSEFLN